MKTPLPSQKWFGPIALLLLVLWLLTPKAWPASASDRTGAGIPASSLVAASGSTGTPDSTTWRTVGLAVAAALAVGISVLGAGYAVARVGSAALGAAAERPELLIRSLLFVALAEGLAVLGFAIAMILAQKIGPI